MKNLPETEHELIEKIQAEYTAALTEGGQPVRDAQHRLAWALVHAKDWTKIQLGIDLSEQLLQLEGSEKREAEYYIAVGQFRQRHYMAARARVNSILERWPNFRQAAELKSQIEDALVKEGLIGLGVGLGAAALVGFGAVAAAFLSKR